MNYYIADPVPVIKINQLNLYEKEFSKFCE